MILPDLNNIAFLAFIAPLAIFWQQVRGFITKVFSFFIRTDTLRGWPTAFPVVQELLSNSKVLRWGNVAYNNRPDVYVKPLQFNWRVFFSVHKDLVLLYNGRIPVIVRGDGSANIKVTYLYKSLNLDEIVERAYWKHAKDDVMRSKEHEANRFYIVERGGREDYGDVAPSKMTFGNAPTSDSGGGGTTLLDEYDFLGKHINLVGLRYDDLGYPKEQLEKRSTYYWQAEGKKLREEVQFWLESRKWFEERELPWRRSALLYGAGGCGKSKMVIEVARVLNIPVVRLNISYMSNDEFVGAFRSVDAGSIILIEDIDVVMQGRDNVQSKAHVQKPLLSFDTLINTINGVQQSQGMFLVMTTNNIGALDKALLRAGRLDSKIEVGPLDQQGKRFIADSVLSDWPEIADELASTVDELPVVEFQHRCIERAISEYNKRRGT